MRQQIRGAEVDENPTRGRVGVLRRLQTYVSRPFPQRYNRHQDTNDYRQPQPRLPMQYLTYWRGNQLPGFHLQTMGRQAIFMDVRDHRVLYTSSPQAAQRASGSFNVVLSQEGSADIVARWRQMWQTQASKG